jgi:translation elongation factor EF-Ts
VKCEPDFLASNQSFWNYSTKITKDRKEKEKS